MIPVSARIPARVAGAVAATVWAVSAPAIAIPAASADACSDIAVVFARGTREPAGLGSVGQAFVDSIGSQAKGRSVTSYAVNYPASDDYHGSAAAGADDASAHIQDVAASCPNTKMVLGGYSQGAAVIDLATNQMPPSVADHVAAVALFGEPTSGLSSALYGGQPLPTINPLYGGKMISLCAPDDPICSPGGNIFSHLAYIQNGMVIQAATFAVGKLGPASSRS
nr:cutinase family protein [Mycobacterium sp. Marseille-P9652]